MSTTSQEPSTTTRDEIFISYSRRDKRWVDGYLRRLLEAANVPFVIDEEDFEIGAPLDENIRRLIKECRYTLLVMTPDWVRGKWTHYESELAVQDTPGKQGVSVLPLKLRDCDIPPHIVSNLYLDISRARTRDKEIVKLLRQLKVPEDLIKEAQNSVAKKPLWFLIEVVHAEPDIRDKMAAVDDMLGEIQRSNDILQINKTLHDRLQEVEFPLKQLMETLIDQSVTLTEPKDWERIRGATSALRHKLQLLVDYADSIDESRVDVSFVLPFTGLADEIDCARRSHDSRSFRACVDGLPSQISRLLPRVNQNIVNQVKERKLRDLVQNLETIYELVADIDFDDVVSELLGQFESKIKQLLELEKTIQEEVDDHLALQIAEDTIHLFSPDDEPTYYNINKLFPKVKPYIEQLKLTDRYSSLLEWYRDLSEQLSDDQNVRDDDFEESVKCSFREFVDELKYSFNKLDFDLLGDCGKLKPRTDELNELLNRMKNNDH